MGFDKPAHHSTAGKQKYGLVKCSPCARPLFTTESRNGCLTSQAGSYIVTVTIIIERFGVRITKQRQIILEELKKLCSHPSADELYELVRRRLPHVSLGTVYRNLDLLSQQGLILKLSTAGGQARYDGNIRRHDHVRCLSCGRVQDVPTATVEGITLPESPPGFVITEYRLEFLGRCPDCRE